MLSIHATRGYLIATEHAQMILENAEAIKEEAEEIIWWWYISFKINFFLSNLDSHLKIIQSDPVAIWSILKL